eukprot:s3699_g1.t1
MFSSIREKHRSLFEGLQTQAAESWTLIGRFIEPPQKDADSSGSGLFGSLSVAGEGTSAFSFLNSDTQQEPVGPVPSSQTSGVPAESIFTFVNSADVADPVAPATSAYPTGGASAGESSPSLTGPHRDMFQSGIVWPGMLSLQNSVLHRGDSSAFSFIGGLQESVPRDREVAGALDVPEGTRRKTRKALLPGHASRPQEVQHKI